MIQYRAGNLMESEADVLVNTVNTVGVMGKGIALQFKNQFPHNFKVYSTACKEKTLRIGQLLVVEDQSLLYGKKTIVNLPTKTDWKKPSEYQYIELGLAELVKFIQDNHIQSIAIPPLGAGNGGLDWSRVRQLLEKYLAHLDCIISIYEPTQAIKEVLRKERVALTPARAMLLAVLYELVRQGEFVSEFASEKICYFLQRFGATDTFKLDFQPRFYGPYSGKVKHVLYYLNGSYLSGYSSKDKKPFEELSLMMDAEPDVLRYLDQDELQRERAIVHQTKTFLAGFYSNFALELLSTLDVIVQPEQTADMETIKKKLANWSKRKSKQFANDTALQIGLRKLAELPPDISRLKTKRNFVRGRNQLSPTN